MLPPLLLGDTGDGIRAKEPEDAEREVLALRAQLEGLQGLELEAKFSELAVRKQPHPREKRRECFGGFLVAPSKA